MGNKIKVQLNREFENCNFQLSFLKLDISVDNKVKRVKIVGCVAKVH